MLPVFIGAVLLAACLAFVTASHGNAEVLTPGNDDRLVREYARIGSGMPFSQLDAIGFNTAKAERLPRKALMERFMPKDKAQFDALDPAVKNCYRGSDDCTAYIFDLYTDQVLLLVQGGRVTWKMMFNFEVT